MRSFMVLTVSLALGGCYTYGPAPNGAPEPGTRIRVELTDQGTADLARLVGPGVVAIEGRYTGAEADALRVGVSTVRLRRGDDQFWAGEPVIIPRTAVAHLERREFSPMRTAILGGSLAAGALLLVEVFNGGESLFGGKGGRTGGEQ